MYDEHFLDLYGRRRADVTSRAGQRRARPSRPKSLARPSQVQRRARDRGAAVVGFRDRRLPDTTLCAAGGGCAGSAHRVRQCRQPAVGAARGAITRAGHSRGHRCRSRPHRSPGADRKPGARRHRRHRRRAARLVAVTDPGGERPDGCSPPGNRDARSHGRPCGRWNGAGKRGTRRTATRAADRARARASRRARRWQRRHERNGATVGPPNAHRLSGSARADRAGRRRTARAKRHQSSGSADWIRYVGSAQRAGCAAGRAVWQPASRPARRS